MKRIDTINARENMFGIGKSGFHDNADLPGQDATYVSPEWFNTVQEELCNLLELRGITLNPASKRQLYDLLTTQADLEALADEIETNFVRKNQIVDNLTTNDADKVASARTVKQLQDNKLEASDLKDASTSQKGVVQLNNTLTSNSIEYAATAGVVNQLYEMFRGGTNRFRIPNPNDPAFPWIVQMGEIQAVGDGYTTITFGAAFTQTAMFAFAQATKTAIVSGIAQSGWGVDQLTATTMRLGSDNVAQPYFWIAIGK